MEKNNPPQFPQKKQLPESSGSIELTWSGPLPPPAALERFNDILPGAAERIFNMAEGEIEHRHFVEKKSYAIRERGQWMGFIAGMVSMLLSFYLISSGQSIYGVIGLVVAIFWLSGVFVYKTRASQKQKQPSHDR